MSADIHMKQRGNHSLSSLEMILSVRFLDKERLLQALTHKSYLNESGGEAKVSNSRLEFLGDAVLGLIVAEELYRLYPEWLEGRLTEARSVLVRGDTLADVAEELGLGMYLCVGKGEEKAGGRERPSNLAAAFEALVGAIFLDQGFDVAKDFVLRELDSKISNLDSKGEWKSAKSILQEAVQSKGLDPPTYTTASIEGEDPLRKFKVQVDVDGQILGCGLGTRKSQAEERAAGQALKRL